MTDDFDIPKTPSVDLDALLESIKTKTREQFPSLKTVEDFFNLKETVPDPAIAFEISGFESDGPGDIGTGQYAAEISLSAYCIVSYKKKDGSKAKRRAVSLAASFAAFLKLKTWGVHVSIPEQINAYPDALPSPNETASAYEVWRVDWIQRGLLGESIWEEEPPLTVYLGQAPNIGPGHEDDYIIISRPPETGEDTPTP